MRGGPGCEWADRSAAMRRYHDDEWGIACHDDRRLFEMLTLEGAQAGLSWSTILDKREGYRQAFAGFDPEVVARFGEATVEALLADPGIVRNRLKVRGTVGNARCFLATAEEHGTFAAYLWSWVGGTQVVNRPRCGGEVATGSDLGDRLGKDLRSRGFTFVGGTIVYSYLQAVGVVDDHLVTCPAKRGPAERRPAERGPVER